MNTILVKLLALALALGQVTTEPESVRTYFDPIKDQGEAARILKAGCVHMRQAFGIEDFNLDDLITLAMDDPEAVSGGIPAFHGLDFKQLYVIYRQYCTDKPIDGPDIDLGPAIAFYDNAAANIADERPLIQGKLPGTTTVLDGNDVHFAELYKSNHRRIWIGLDDVPEHVRMAFVAAEDKRFYEHQGIDQYGLIRAFVENFADKGRARGGSTITQQVAKNLLVGDDVTYERKIRELIVAGRMERVLPKSRILELYLNSIYLGRGSWGIEMAARSYFGKSASDLNVAEAALLAGLTKGPNYYGPDRHPERARERQAYVIERMQADGTIDADTANSALAADWHPIPYERLRRDTGYYFVDEVAREAKRLAGLDSLTEESYTIHGTVVPLLQRATEAALQQGLAKYEAANGRSRRQVEPELNLAETVKKREQEAKSSGSEPAWRTALRDSSLPLYDVHWTPAIILGAKYGKHSSGSLLVGLADGRVLPLAGAGRAGIRALKTYDVIYVEVSNQGARSSAQAQLRIRPTVQGAAVVLENKTGRVLAMAGGFSYPLSQINRVTQTQRQPGSALKPLTYLAALRSGLQPNTLVLDAPITLPAINPAMRAQHLGSWTPKNYDGGSSGIMTLRRALEMSRNVVTARLLDGAIERKPEDSLADVCALAREAKIYRDCIPFYPFVLGAQPVRLIDLAGFYAAVANEGRRVSPHVIDSITLKGDTIYRAAAPTAEVDAETRATYYQLRTMLQGVVERGTARAMHRLVSFIGGKTGTSNNENDAWFFGFTNDVTIGVWIGYDNAHGKRRTLGGGNTGGHVAIPIFENVLAASWSLFAPQAPLAEPSAEAAGELIALPIDLMTGQRLVERGGHSFTEYFRLDRRGHLNDTRDVLLNGKADGSWRQPSKIAAAPLPEVDAPADEMSGATAGAGEGGDERNRDAGARTADASHAAVAAALVPVPPERPPTVPVPASVAAPPTQPPVREPLLQDFFGTPRWAEEARERRSGDRADPDYFWGRGRR